MSALEALQVSVTLTDQKVAINSVLGSEEPDSRLITIEQTSGCFSVGDYNYKAIYVLNPVAVKVLVA